MRKIFLAPNAATLATSSKVRDQLTKKRLKMTVLKEMSHCLGVTTLINSQSVQDVREMFVMEHSFANVKKVDAWDQRKCQGSII